MGLEFKYQKGQTPLDQNEIDGLLLKTITTMGELNEFEQMNIEKAVEWTIHNKFTQELILSEEFVKLLHKKMYSDVWRWAGHFRKSDKNLGINWTQIRIQLKILLDDVNFWIENNIYTPVEIAIRFKHRIVSIHCFPNGNGRHSRLIADIIMESIFASEPFYWHQSNMVKADDTRQKYIDALQAADKGKIKPLIEFATN
jgi:Fic-DOC domain mobile mystery protein B